MSLSALEQVNLNQVIPSFGSPTLENFDTRNAEDGQRIGGSSRQYVRFYNRVVPKMVAVDAVINEQTGAAKVNKYEVQEVQKEFVQIGS